MADAQRAPCSHRHHPACSRLLRASGVPPPSFGSSEHPFSFLPEGGRSSAASVPLRERKNQIRKCERAGPAGSRAECLPTGSWGGHPLPPALPAPGLAHCPCSRPSLGVPRGPWPPGCYAHSPGMTAHAENSVGATRSHKPANHHHSHDEVSVLSPQGTLDWGRRRAALCGVQGCCHVARGSPSRVALPQVSAASAPPSLPPPPHRALHAISSSHPCKGLLRGQRERQGGLWHGGELPSVSHPFLGSASQHPTPRSASASILSSWLAPGVCPHPAWGLSPWPQSWSHWGNGLETPSPVGEGDKQERVKGLGLVAFDGG